MHWVLSDALSWREVGDEIIVLHEPSSRYLSFNSSAAELWRRLATGGATQDELCGLLRNRYGIGEDAATADVAAFVADCRAKALIRPAGSEPAG